MSASSGSPFPSSAAATPAGKPRSRKRAIALGVGVVAVVAVLAWTADWWLVGRFIESTDDAYLQADSVTIAPKVSGYVTQVYVADNQVVQAGDPLVRLDNRQYRAALDQAQATVDARQADIERALAEIRQQNANVAQAQAQQRVARLSVQHAQDEVRRYRPLAATGAETSERLANLSNERDQALATLAANEAAVQAAQAQIAVSTAQIAQARAQLEAAQASARQANLDLQDTLVRATLAGNVGDRTVRVGQYVQPGTRMMTVVPVQDVYLQANFKETQIGRMRPGQPATLHVDALPGMDLHGMVDSFAPGTGAQFALLPPENATGNFTKIVQRVPVRIRVDADADTRALLVPGLSVTADVDTRAAGNTAKKGTSHG
jgi:membrane fusion protein (multidrug efflux system)